MKDDDDADDDDADNDADNDASLQRHLESTSGWCEKDSVFYRLHLGQDVKVTGVMACVVHWWRQHKMGSNQKLASAKTNRFYKIWSRWFRGAYPELVSPHIHVFSLPQDPASADLCLDLSVFIGPGTCAGPSTGPCPRARASSPLLCSVFVFLFIFLGGEVDRNHVRPNRGRRKGGFA